MERVRDKEQTHFQQSLKDGQSENMLTKVLKWGGERRK